MRKIFFILTTLFYLPLVGEVGGSFMFAQSVQTSSSMLKAGTKGATAVSFDVNADIATVNIPAQPVKWGMDTAWDWDQNVVRGANAIGTEILANGIGRVSFQTTDLVDANGDLSAAQKTALQSRLDHIALSGTKNINLNSDQETYCGVSEYVANYKDQPENWYKVIKATVKYCRSKGFNVVSISPFNEPDYAGWNQGSQASFKEVCRLISEDADLAGIELCGGNTLNDDYALSWYNYNKEYLKKGNTHQLAGSMANYTAFWEQVAKDGRTGVADELHNCMEGFIAFHHGCQEGIWWGWEGNCRGELCKATTYGKEIGYAENSDCWSGAAVYKWVNPVISDNSGNSDNSGISGASAGERIEAFLGCSERQAKPSTFDLVSTDRPAYYNGYGPVYSYSQYVTADPNGSYQSSLQKNAECMIDIEYGEDVPTDDIRRGKYVIMNLNSLKCMYYSATDSKIKQVSYFKKPSTYQYWVVQPVAEDCGGDFGYFTLKSPEKPSYLTDSLNITTAEEWSLETGKGVKCDNNWANAGREYWSFEYAGDNSWYIRNKYTGLYLQAQGASTDKDANIVMSALTGKNEQKWRFIPVLDDMTKMTKMEVVAPAKPTGLSAQQLAGSVKLSWNANTETDLAGYNILRARVSGGSGSSNLSGSSCQWDMIGRIVTGTSFIDNDAISGITYEYKIKAVDNNRNQSAASDSVTIVCSPEKNLVAHYTFDSSVSDTTESCHDAVFTSAVSYGKPFSGCKEGRAALYFNGSTTFGVLPPAVCGMKEMTIAAWIYRPFGASSWMRLFDFGNDQTHYFFFTPNNGSEARLVLKNGGDEQILSTSSLSQNSWHYVAVTLAKDSVSLYIDDRAVTSKSITIRPSDFMPKRNYIGCSQFPADPLFKGYIDDLRIYNYALSAKEVAALKEGKELPADLEGDVNNDGNVDSLDIRDVISVICGDMKYNDTADINNDGAVNIMDVNTIISIIIKK